MRLVPRARGRTLALTLLLTLASAASASAHDSSPVGHIYVNDNTAGINTIAAFDRHRDGTLTPVPGSPFATGGAGTGVSIGSQGALETSEDGRYLLAVDAGSNEISVLRIRPDGTLRPVSNGVVPSGGVKPVSIAVHDDLVYVANAGAGGTNYTGFLLGRGGHLRPLPGSTFALPDTSQPGDVLFNSDGRNLVGTRINTSLIDSFRVGGDGRLVPAPNSPIPAQGPGPFGSEFRPTDPSQLFISNAHGGANAGTISAFSVAGNGTLSSIGSSPFADNQTAPCWVEISHDGRFLFTTNTASATISRYLIHDDGSLELLGSTPFNGAAGPAPVDVRLSRSGGTLWVVDSKTAAVSGFRVDGGQLTELPSSPTSLPAGATPFGIVVTGADE